MTKHPPNTQSARTKPRHARGLYVVNFMQVHEWRLVARHLMPLVNFWRGCSVQIHAQALCSNAQSAFSAKNWEAHRKKVILVMGGKNQM